MFKQSEEYLPLQIVCFFLVRQHEFILKQKCNGYGSECQCKYIHDVEQNMTKQ